MLANPNPEWDNDTVEGIRKALMTEPQSRSPNDLKMLRTFLFTGNLMDKLKLDKSDFDSRIKSPSAADSEKDNSKNILLKKLLRSMRYQWYQERSTVFDFGDIGDLFYIIFSGAVSVQIPVESKMDNSRIFRSDIIVLNEKGEMVQKQLTTVAKLKAGHWFGELALINSRPRAATIKCIETPTELVTISKNDYNIIIGGKVKLELKNNINILRKFQIFKDYTDRRLEKVLQYCSFMNYCKGSHIYKKNDAVSGFYLTTSGTFEIICKPQSDKNSLKSPNFVMAIICGYQIIGLDEIATEEKKREYSVRCSSISGTWIFVKDNAFCTQSQPQPQSLSQGPLFSLLNINDFKANLNLRKSRMTQYYKNVAKISKLRPKSPLKHPVTGETFQDIINRQKIKGLLVRSGILKKNNVSSSWKLWEPKTYADRLSRQFSELIHKPNIIKQM